MARHGGPEPSVAELVARAQAGSAEARARLVERYYRPLRLFLRRQTGDPALADDLAHDTLLAALAHLDALEDPARFRAWLFRIAARHALMEQRRRQRERERTVPLDAVADLPTPDISPRDELVRQVLAELSPALREALEGRVLHGEDLPRLARRVGRSVAAVRKSLTQAKARFAMVYAEGRSHRSHQGQGHGIGEREDDGADRGRPAP